MIRVLQVVTHMNRGGLETMLMNYYRKIDKRRVQFDFMVHRQERADYDDEIESLGGIIYRMPVLNPFSYRYKKTLTNFFVQHKEYRIIHVHQDCLSSVILKAGMECGIPVRIAHSHSTSQDKNMKYLIKMFYKQFIARYATYLMACNELAGKWMFTGSGFHVLNNAIDARKYTFDPEKRRVMRKNLGLSPDTLLIGHVGRFSSVKNHTFLIDIFKEIAGKTPAVLLLVGSGEQQKEIREKVGKYGLQEKVIFTGVRSDVVDLLQAMDVFVFPSLYEGLSVSLIEAQASGLPCLISDKVPIECKKTDLVWQLSLKECAEKWAVTARRMADMERKNTYKDIKAAGYDLAENVKWLEEFYLEKYKAG